LTLHARGLLGLGCSAKTEQQEEDEDGGEDVGSHVVVFVVICNKINL
jgi:hypothetical protein